MIINGFSYLSVLLIIVGIVLLMENSGKIRVFKYIPSIVIVYFLVMLGCTLGIWGKSQSIDVTYISLKDNLLLSMIFLMLLRCDMKKIIKLGPKMIIGFISSTISIGVGFILSYIIFKNRLPDGSWKIFSTLAGTWMGGTGNMIALQKIFNVPDHSMGYVLITDSINYSLWVMILLWAVAFAPRFNKWTKANTLQLEQVSKNLNSIDNTSKNKENNIDKVEFYHIILLLALSFGASAFAQYISKLLPSTYIFTESAWSTIIVTLLGICVASTRISKIPGSTIISSVFLYVIVALIGSRANVRELGKAPIFILAGAIIIGIHAIIMIIVAKLLKLDLFTCGVSSLSNIGGVASAPILASAYNDSLIPVGILMSLLGYVIGTGGGIIVGNILMRI